MHWTCIVKISAPLLTYNLIKGVLRVWRAELRTPVGNQKYIQVVVTMMADFV